jgi:acyl-CoA thioester hydrolase
MSDRPRLGSGRVSDGVHVFPVRVYYEDTDAGGVVYYANYLKFAERARTEMMHLLDAGYGDLVAEGGLTFAVRRCEVDFLAPARLDDVLEVRTKVTATDAASVSDEKALTRLHVRLACLNDAGRPARIPSALRAALQTLNPI